MIYEAMVLALFTDDMIDRAKTKTHPNSINNSSPVKLVL